MKALQLQATSAPTPHEPKGIQLIVLAPLVGLSVWLVLFYSYCLRIKETIGRWPSSSFEKIPLEIDRGFHDSVVWWLLEAIAILVVPWFLLIAYHLWWSKRISFDRRVVFAFGSWLVFILIFVIDPKGLITWFLD